MSFLAERALGRPLSDIPGPRFSIDIERRGEGFAARLETHTAADSSGAAGVGSFRAPSCDELVETLGLAVAIARGARRPDTGSPEAHADARQAAARIQTFCDGLDESRRALLVLALIEDVPAREIAPLLGVPLFTVYSPIRGLRAPLERFLAANQVPR